MSLIFFYLARFRKWLYIIWKWNRNGYNWAKSFFIFLARATIANNLMTFWWEIQENLTHPSSFFCLSCWLSSYPYFFLIFSTCTSVFVDSLWSLSSFILSNCPQSRFCLNFWIATGLWVNFFRLITFNPVADFWCYINLLNCFDASSHCVSLSNSHTFVHIPLFVLGS